MYSLNVLIAGDGKYAAPIRNSKYLNKLYVTNEKEVEGASNISFNTFQGLADKCKALQIDLVIVEDEKFVLEGISNVMKKNFINCFAVTSEWTNLGLSHNYAKKLLSKYNIKTPPVITLPIEFPVLVKGDGILKKANSLQEIISIKEQIFKVSPEISKTVFIEKFLYGNKARITFLFDGKNLLTFPDKNIDCNLLTDYSNKLESMLINEKAKFIGFFNSDVIQEDNILYNASFSYEFKFPDFIINKPDETNDILYICNSALYQKLNEINLLF